MKKPSIIGIATAIVGLVVGLGGALVAGGIGSPAYLDADTDQLFPAEVPPTKLVTPRNGTKTLTVSATNTISTTDVATATPEANAIPMAKSNGKLDNGWLESTVATGTGMAYRYAQWNSSGTALTYSSMWEAPSNGWHRDSVGNDLPVYFTAYPGTTAAAGSVLTLLRSRGTSPASMVPTLSGDLIGGLQFKGTGTGNSEVLAGSIYAWAAANSMAGSQPLKLVLQTVNTSGTENINQLVLETDGNVSSSGKIAATNPMSCTGMTCNGASTASLLSTGTLNLTVTPATVGALPAASVSGTQNYLAKFGATGATLGNSNTREENGYTRILGNGGWPSTSTSSVIQTAIMRLANGSAADVLDIGVSGTGGGTWLQATHADHLNYTYPIVLNPNGGPVSVGTKSPINLGMFQFHGNANENIFARKGGEVFGGAVTFDALNDAVNTVVPMGIRASPLYLAGNLTQTTGNISSPGTITSGTAGGTAGTFVLNGSTSGSLTLKAAAAATQCTTGQAPYFTASDGTLGCLTPALASSISGTQNYHAKFGAGGGTVGNSNAYDSGTSVLAPQFYGTTIGGGSAAGLMSQSLAIYNPGGGTDQKMWDFNGGNGVFSWRAVNDANSSATTFMSVSRTGLTINNIDFLNGTVRVGSSNQFQVTNAGVVSAPTYQINGSTSGTVTHGVAATTASYSMLAPSTAPAAGQGIVYPVGGGQGTWVTPVPATRNVTCGFGLSQTGGPALSSDVTCAVGPDPDGSISVSTDTIKVGTLATDAQHGNRGGGALHSDATVSTSGFMSAAQVTKLNGLPSSAVPTTRTISTTNGLQGGNNMSVDITLSPVYGSAANTVCQGNDSRLSDDRITQWLRTTTGNVYVNYAAPSAGQVLQADSSTGASWHTISSNAIPKPPGFNVQSAGTASTFSASDHTHAGILSLPCISGQAYSQIVIGTTPGIICSHSVFWDKMPSNLALYSAWSVRELAGLGSYCYFTFYTGSQSETTLGGTTMAATVLTSVPPSTAMMSSTSYEFTKPSGTNGTYSLLQVYGYCTQSTQLHSLNFYISAGNY